MKAVHYRHNGDQRGHTKRDSKQRNKGNKRDKMIATLCTRVSQTD
jgi:hypothetical protein